MCADTNPPLGVLECSGLFNLHLEPSFPPLPQDGMKAKKRLLMLLFCLFLLLTAKVLFR